MKKYTVLSVLTLACLNLQAAELDSVRFAGYTTNAVSAGYSILAVPFSGYNTNSFAPTNISLNELISTNGLTIDDQLIAFDEATTNYYWYALGSDGWNALPVNQIGGDITNHVVIGQGDPLSEVTKAQGYAFWLNAQNPTTVYLQGIANTSEVGVLVVSNAFTLVGNALPSPLDLNNAEFKGTNSWFKSLPGEGEGGDLIFAVNPSTGGYTTYMFVDTTWYKSTPTGPVEADPIPAGLGVWFKRDGEPRTLILK